MRVREIMTSPAVSVAATITVQEAAALMVRDRINSLVVTGVGGEPAVVGLLSAAEVELAEAVVPFTVPSVRADRLRDLWAQTPDQLYAALAVIAQRCVGDVMRTPVETMGPDADVWTAMDRMARLGITRMPVVEDDRLIGLVARHDIMKVIAALPGR